MIELSAKNIVNFDIAIPDSFLYGIKSDIDRTFKIFQLARSTSIFRVANIFIYHDRIINPTKTDKQFMITLLEYLDTPQYLRKKIYPQLSILKYVGKLHPLRSPHHKDKISLKDIKNGETRVGILEKKGSNYFVDVGLESLIPYKGNSTRNIGQKINVIIIRDKGFLHAKDIEVEAIKEIYWGYKVIYNYTVREVLKNYPGSQVILTSRLSSVFDGQRIFSKVLKDSGHPISFLIVFGSPKFGLHEIFKEEKIDISKYSSFNFFPNQGTQTVRLEESILGVLSILNFESHARLM